MLRRLVGPSSSSRPDLLEREAELAALRTALADAVAGSGRLVLVEGNPGAGRTSLLAAAEALGAEAGMTTLSARGGAFESAEGFGLVRQLFERAVARAAPTERERLLAGAAALAAVPLALDAGAPSPPPDPAQVRHGLYWLLANLADRGPLTLLIDDAQWADIPSLEWLLYAVRRIERLPILVVAATAAGDPQTPRALLDALAVEPIAASLSLAPLSEAGTAVALAALLDRPSVDDAFARACHEWTGGNPHYVTETAAALAEAKIEPGPAAIARLHTTVPSKVAAVTLLRIGRLSTEAAEVAGALAILGGDAEREQVAALAGLDDSGAVAAIDALAEARLIEASPRPRFAQALLERSVYESLGSARRAAQHARAARILDAAGAAPGAVAAQLLRTEPGGDPWVAETLGTAAAAELARGAASTAVPLLRRALAEPPPAAAEAATLAALGRAEALASEPGGLDSLRAAVEASSGIERAGAVLLLARFLVYAGRGSEVVERVEPVLAELDGADPALRARLEAALVTAARAEGGLREVADRHLDAVRDLADVDFAEGRVVAVQCAYAATAAGDSVEEAVALARTALGDGRLLDEEPLSPDVYLVPISMLAICDELEEAEAGFEEALGRARRSGSPLAYAAGAAIAAGAAVFAGRLDAAELLARDALRIAAESPGLEALRGFAGVHLALVLIERGEAEAALDLLGGDVAAHADSVHTWSREALFALGRAHLAAGRPAEALAALQACGKLSESLGIRNPAFLPWRSIAAAAALALRDDEEAARLAAEEVELARRFGARRPLGTALRTAGLVAGGEAGLELLSESVEQLAASPARLERARSLVELGAALRRGGRRAESREPLASGLALAEQCGAAPLVGQAREELSASGARVRAGGRWDADALTPSELRTCRMAAEGLSNPAIAQALFVTRATIESHLHAAYRKLGISSRTELAAALVEYS
jgi:DNA-binding CsgD family transcriptional regulator